jgi:hypothetical protein
VSYLKINRKKILLFSAIVLLFLAWDGIPEQVMILGEQINKSRVGNFYEISN